MFGELHLGQALSLAQSGQAFAKGDKEGGSKMGPGSFVLRLKVGSSNAYDADGNTITVNGLTAYAYGPFNRLVNAGGTHYVVVPEKSRKANADAGFVTNG